MSSISFSNGVTLQLSIQDGFYLGIGEARMDGEIFLVAGRGNRPYCVTPDGIAYTQFKVLDRVSDREGISVECEAIGYAAPLQLRADMFGFPQLSPLNGTFTDKLRIRFLPRTSVIGAETYRGFEVTYNWESPERQIHWFNESVTLAPGGYAEGARMLAQPMTAKSCPLDQILHLDTFFSTAETYDTVCIQSPARGGGSSIFDLVCGARLAAVSFFESAISHGKALKGTCQKLTGEDFVTVSDLHYGKLASNFSTAPRVVLATRFEKTTREADINRWTAMFDHTSQLWCEELGIKKAKSMPTLGIEGTGIGGVDPGTTYPEMLIDWAKRIDWVVEQGFQAILLHTPEWIGAANRKTYVFGGNNCSPWQFRLSDFLGGDEGLRVFCDACHARGIKVFFWIAGHLQREAPVWKKHPDWVVRDQCLSVWDAHYGSIHALSFVHGGAEWLLGDLKATREATGVDGIWFDSFANLTIGPVNYQSPGVEPNAPAVLRFLGDLSAAGFEIMIEGISQLGISSWGNIRIPEITGCEELMLNTGLRYYIDREWPNVDRDLYFRMLAARAPLGAWLAEYLGRPAPFPPALPDWYAPLTCAFNQVASRMENRRLIKGGALWTDADGRPSAFFAFEDLKGIEGFQGSATLNDLITHEKQDADKPDLRKGRIYEVLADRAFR